MPQFFQSCTQNSSLEKCNFFRVCSQIEVAVGRASIAWLFSRTSSCDWPLAAPNAVRGVPWRRKIERFDEKVRIDSYRVFVCQNWHNFFNTNSPRVRGRRGLRHVRGPRTLVKFENCVCDSSSFSAHSRPRNLVKILRKLEYFMTYFVII